MQIGNRGEHAAGDYIAFDLGEPEVDLVQPRGPRRGEVKANVRVHRQEWLDLHGLTRRELVGDDADFLAYWSIHHDVVEKADELGRSMALVSLARHLTGPGVSGRIQRQRAVAKRLEAVAPSARHGDSGSIGSLRSSA